MSNLAVRAVFTVAHVSLVCQYVTLFAHVLLANTYVLTILHVDQLPAAHHDFAMRQLQDVQALEITYTLLRVPTQSFNVHLPHQSRLNAAVR
jgi:hypothetical protein